MPGDQSQFQLTDQKRRVALITGGTSGIGGAIAEALAPNFDLALSYHHNHDRAESFAAGLMQRFPNSRIKVYGIPLSTESDCETLHQAVANSFEGEIGVLVNSAGRLRDGLFLGTDLDQHIALMQEHLMVPMVLTHRLIKGMYKQQFGRIIHLSSISARRFKMGQVNYSTAKAGIEGFTRSLAREVSHRGITINAIAPGLIRTPMTSEIVANLEIDKKNLKSRIPAGFVGEPQDIGNLAAFLCSSQARYITGQVIDVCGGRSLVGD